VGRRVSWLCFPKIGERRNGELERIGHLSRLRHVLRVLLCIVPTGDVTEAIDGREAFCLDGGRVVEAELNVDHILGR